MPSLAARLLARVAGYVATFSCLHVISAVAIAQSCTPAAPRIDSGAGFVPFGANEQVVARGGNKGPAWEWAVGTDTDAGQKVQGSLDWVSGKVYGWKLINSGSGSEVLEIRDERRLRLRLVYPSGMDAGNALELQVIANPRIGPGTTIEASITSLNGHGVSGSVAQSGSRRRSAQALYYFFPPMVQGFVAEGTVRLAYMRKPPKGSRVEFTVRAGTIPCNSTGSPPRVSITAPAANSNFTAPTNITVAADAHDPDGAVTKVEFFANDNSIGMVSSSPFSIQWAILQAGVYSLTAVAADDKGLQTTSAAMRITVSGGQVLYFIHVDHLNSPRLIADRAQKTVWRWDQLEPFGNNTAIENLDRDAIAFNFPQRFPGQYSDAETLLRHNYFRDYDPSIGRFAQSDPIGLDGGLNTYLYGHAAPLRYVDLLGLAGCGPEGGWQNYFIPNNPAGFPFEPCCDSHDLCYDNCRGPDKFGCDTIFCGCVFDKCKKYTGYVQTTCRRTAQEYCYRVLDSQAAAEQFNKARAGCSFGMCKP